MTYYDAPMAITRRPILSVLAVVPFVLAACGGGDDEAAATTTVAPTTTVPAPATTVAPATTAAPTTTTTVPTTVTEGATVVVANASSVNGSAGRMSEILAGAGFEMGTPTNSTEGKLGATKVYFAAGDEAALAVAESLVRLLGGAVELLELPTVPPVASSDLGPATVLLTLGDDFADQDPTVSVGG